MTAAADPRAAFVALAVQVARRTADADLPALGPITVAQAVLESNYGRSGLSATHRNYFGMKAGSSWRGPVAVMDTTENLGPAKVAVRVKGAFRVYRSIDESFVDHAGLFRRNPRTYAKALAHPRDPVAFAHALTGVYATDPLYGSKLVRVMREWKLVEAFGGPAPSVVALAPQGTAPALLLVVAIGAVALWRGV